MQQQRHAFKANSIGRAHLVLLEICYPFCQTTDDFDVSLCWSRNNLLACLLGRLPLVIQSFSANINYIWVQFWKHSLVRSLQYKRLIQIQIQISSNFSRCLFATTIIQAKFEYYGLQFANIMPCLVAMHPKTASILLSNLFWAIKSFKLFRNNHWKLISLFNQRPHTWTQTRIKNPIAINNDCNDYCPSITNL